MRHFQTPRIGAPCAHELGIVELDQPLPIPSRAPCPPNRVAPDTSVKVRAIAVVVVLGDHCFGSIHRLPFREASEILVRTTRRGNDATNRETEPITHHPDSHRRPRISRAVERARGHSRTLAHPSADTFPLRCVKCRSQATGSGYCSVSRATRGPRWSQATMRTGSQARW